MELSLPKSSYGLAIVEPAILNRKHDGNFMFFMEIGRVFFMLSLTFILTGLFLLQVWKMNESGNMNLNLCSNEIVLLEFACVFLFEVAISREVTETMTCFSILWMAPAPKSSSTAGAIPNLLNRNYSPACTDSPKTGAVLAASDSGGRFSQMFRRSRSADDCQWKLDGISNAFRVSSMLTVAAPKLLLEILLAYLGGVYILKSADEGAMVMNTLAVVFIADIDEVLYTAFTSNVVKFNLSHMKTVDVDLSNQTRVAMWFASSVLCPLITVAASAWIVLHTKRLDCPDYMWSWREVFAGLLTS